MDTLDLELNRTSYNHPRLSILSWALTFASLGCVIGSHYGNYPESVDLCLYPRAAQIKDEVAREKQLQDSSLGNESKVTYLLGTKFCNYKRGDIVTLPKSYVRRAANSSLNDSANKEAIISAGLKEGWLYRYQEVPAENPLKLPLAVLSFGLGLSAIACIQYQKDKQAQLRPMYRATMLLENRRAGYSLSLAESDLQMSANLMLAKLRGIREAETRQYFLSKITDEQAFNLLGSMTSEDYQDFGYLLDGGVSYSKFLQPSVTEKAELESKSNYETVSNKTEESKSNYETVNTKTEQVTPDYGILNTKTEGYSVDEKIIIEKDKPSDNLLFERIRNNKKGHLFIPCETGAGKTTMLLGVLKYLVNYGWKFSVSTSKLDPWGGLENLTEDDDLSKVIRLSSDPMESDTILSLKKRMEWLMMLLRQRQIKEQEANNNDEVYNPVPYVFILDEWLETLRIARRYDSKNKTRIADDLIDYVNTFISTSRSAKIYIWVIAQDHQVQNACINTGMTKNLGFIVLGRDGYLNSIEGAIVSKTSIVQDGEIKRKLWEDAKKLSAENPKTSIAYSNILGNEILLIPYLEGISKERFFGDEQEPMPTIKEPPKVAYVKSETVPEMTLKQKLELLISQGKNYKQICQILWSDRSLEEIAPLLGNQCRLDNINILSESAKYLLSMLAGKDYMDVTSADFINLVLYELATFQVDDAIEELTLLGYCSLVNNKIKVL